MTTNEKIAKLRLLMKERKISAYIVSSPDYHQSEYVAEYFKARHFMSAFTGYVGTLAVTADESALWTDGRYFTQAELQLNNSEVKLQKMGEPGVPTVAEYLSERLGEGGTLAFDGRTIALKQGKEFEKMVTAPKKGSIEYNLDLVDAVWDTRPALPSEPVFIHELKYCGESCASKLARLREKMRQLGASVHIITTLDDIAWLFNIRGSDVEFVPFTLCYAIVSHNDAQLFIDERKLDAQVKSHLAENGVHLKNYNDIYAAVKTFTKNDTVLIDPDRINYSMYANLAHEAEIIEAQNPTMMFKAIKNTVQIEHIKNAHILEGVVFTKFIYWIKKNIGAVPLTEISAAQKLTDLRSEQKGYHSLGFSPISGYAEHGAIIHYRATEETNKDLAPQGFYLIDSGGQYYGGTTDTTRTLALGPLTAEQKKHYTAVLKAHLSLSALKFLHGCKGSQVDMAARAPMWALGLDYKHGTGHGIGQFLGGHEGPARIIWRAPEPANETVLEPGMLFSNEPGFYLVGQYGIRLENTILVTKAEQNEFGQFLYMQPLTFTPFEVDAIEASYLTANEKHHLNEYHQDVYKVIAPHLAQEERQWLEACTKPL